jgi:polyvinyl alcohol dehydrogenase (cytochrome)
VTLAALVILLAVRITASDGAWGMASVQQPQAPPGSGEALYREHCASCHETGVPRAVNRQALTRISADNIRFALTKGSMTAQAAKLTPPQLETVVQYLASATDTPSTASANLCGPAQQSRPTGNPLQQPHWNGWGVDLTQRRFQPAAMAQLTASQVPALKLKWAFGFPGVSQAYGQPTIVGGRLFVGSAGRKVYSLNASTGCQYWAFDTEAQVRAAITIAVNGASWVAYVGDQRANVYAIDALTGSLLWKKRVDEYPGSVITGAPTLAGPTLYVSTSSSEEGLAVNPAYECCRFRGSVSALDPATGTVRWKSYTIPEEPKPVRKNAQGVQLWGPSGAAVWSSPTVDVQARRVYVTTGDGYSDPVATTTDAFLAFDADTGKLLWTRQMTANDAYTISCDLPAPLNANCPEAKGPDLDFGSSPILMNLPNGRRLLIAGQKSGVVHALNPDNGDVVWQRRLGQGGKVGGIQWGPAADDSRVYVALSDVVMGPAPAGARGAQPSMLGSPFLLDPKAGGGLFALNPETGAVVWSTPHPGCGDRPGCSPAQSAAVTAIPGVVFSGGLDGHLRAYASADGRIIWDVDTARDYTTVNGVKATGGSLDGPGAVIVGGMLYVNSGYAFVGGAPGNVLLAFSVDGK